MKAKGLLTRGYIVLPRAALPVQAVAREVLRGLTPDEQPGLTEWRLYARKTGWNEAVGKTLRGFRLVKAFSSALTQTLHARLPGENFELDVVRLSMVSGRPAYASHPHFDSEYLNACCTLEGPGTVLYWRDGSGVHSRRTATGATTVLTSQRQQAATGIPSTIHSAPMGVIRRRVLLILFYSRKGVSSSLSLRRNLKAEQKFFQDHFGAPDPEVRLRP